MLTPQEVSARSFTKTMMGGYNMTMVDEFLDELTEDYTSLYKENASEIADQLKDKRTVVLNLESTNKDVARRLIDFLSGVAYAGEGKIKKVAANTYIITPYHVDIEGDLIDELENNGLYF